MNKQSATMALKVTLEPLPEPFNFPMVEEKILSMWNEKNCFKRSLELSSNKPYFNFFDGPPFATGLPHYGHILAGTIKDVVCRYAQQTGYHVPRGFGWDCHGLPVEFEIEKQLGIKSSHDVQKLGIRKYNDACRSIVMRYSEEWRKVVNRTGRWVDFDKGYRTMDVNYMESVWWVFKELWKKKLIYKGSRVMPFSTGCTTPLSNFEANLNYQNVTDPAISVSFQLSEVPNTFLIAWTTTPWTLVSNLALFVNPELTYIKVLDTKTQRYYICLKDRLSFLYPPPKKQATKGYETPYTIIEEFLGATLANMRYIPLFPYFEKDFPSAFCVLCDTFVSDKSGTGIVHSAPGFGEDDERICLREKIVTKATNLCPVDENGVFTQEVVDFAGRYIKSCDNDIISYLQAKNLIFQKSSIVHSYPICWRSDTPLIYKAVSCWFVAVENIRENLIAANATTYWVPDFVKSKRFTNWLLDAKDWNISRNRYWGTPLPVWHSEDWEEIVCVGSIRELEELTGHHPIEDIHRHNIDDLTIPSSREGFPPLRRVKEVFDCWFESGSMPYAQHHYPFENKENFSNYFPADFIAEGLDQTRGWFYTLLVLSTALFDVCCFKNLICSGLILADDGHKMSKRLQNYPEPTKVMDTYGADALRLYLINSPVVRSEPLRFREDGVKNIIKDAFLPLVNAVSFFIVNTNLFLTNPEHKLSLDIQSNREMDRWILAATQSTVQFITIEMSKYRLYTVVPALLNFMNLFTNWYVRMNRRRIKGGEGNDERSLALSTLLKVLQIICRILAPFAPFLSDALYQHIKPLLTSDLQADSVHYLSIPTVDDSLFDEKLERRMNRMMRIVELIRVLRDKIGIPMKMPVKDIIIVHPSEEYLSDLKAMKSSISLEVNTLNITYSSDDTYIMTQLDVNMKTIGMKYRGEASTIREMVKNMSSEEVNDFLLNQGGIVAGKELSMDDVKIIRTFKENLESYVSTTDSDVVILINKVVDTEVKRSWYAREFVNRVQQFRKKLQLCVTDSVDVFFEAPLNLSETILSSREIISQTVKGHWTTLSEMPSAASIIGEDVSLIDNMNVKIIFTKPN